MLQSYLHLLQSLSTVSSSSQMHAQTAHSYALKHAAVCFTTVLQCVEHIRRKWREVSERGFSEWEEDYRAISAADKLHTSQSRLPSPHGSFCHNKFMCTQRLKEQGLGCLFRLMEGCCSELSIADISEWFGKENVSSNRFKAVRANTELISVRYSHTRCFYEWI